MLPRILHNHVTSPPSSSSPLTLLLDVCRLTLDGVGEFLARRSCLPDLQVTLGSEISFFQSLIFLGSQGSSSCQIPLVFIWCSMCSTAPHWQVACSNGSPIIVYFVVPLLCNSWHPTWRPFSPWGLTIACLRCTPCDGKCTVLSVLPISRVVFTLSDLHPTTVMSSPQSFASCTSCPDTTLRLSSLQTFFLFGRTAALPTEDSLICDSGLRVHDRASFYNSSPKMCGNWFLVTVNGVCTATLSLTSEVVSAESSTTSPKIL